MLPLTEGRLGANMETPHGLGPEKRTRLSVSSTYVDATDERPKEEPPEMPEGGLWGWLTVVGAALVQFCGLGYITTFGIYQDFYVREYLSKYSPSNIGWIGGVQLFLTLSLGLFTGTAFDRGYFYHLMISGTLLHGLGLFMLSLTQKNQYYQIFLAQGVCFGLSCGLTYVPTFAILSHYFRQRKSLVIGLVAGGSSLGAVIHPIMLNRLFNGHIGFHNGIRISASINVFLLIVANFLSRTRLPPRKAVKYLQVVEFLRDPPYVCLIIGIFLAFCGLYFPQFYIQLDAMYHNIDRTLAFYVLSILNAANSFGRIIPPMFVSRLGLYNVFTFFTTVMCIVLLCMAAIKDVTSVVITANFYGFFSGGAVSLSPAVLGALAKDIDEVGARIGIAFGLCGVMAMFGDYGRLSGNTRNQRLTLSYSAANRRGTLNREVEVVACHLVCWMSVVFCLIARQMVARRKGSWRV
ncbi:hypothetical protein AX15_005573 [Amanita polypyramis BW_CC]|nr:hypothetical protein AX15_005573 [Amanita polypyramis BW_CC]